MAEDEAIFDPSLRKKKKKKKTPFDLSALEDGSVPATDCDIQAENGLESRDEYEKENREEKDDDGTLDLDDFSMKKKKKKKKPFSLDELETSLPDTNEEMMMVVDDEREGDDAAGTDDDLDFNLPKKKKKKKKKINIDELETEPLDDEDDGEPAFEGDEIKIPSSVSSVSWGGTDRDYTYDELLQRVFNIMREKNPDMVAGEKKRFVMRPPQVLRIGTKKTSFANFLEICKTLHRQPKHLQAFLLAELGTSGSVDANNQLIIKGRFQQKQIENVLRRYIKEYVTCHTCRSPETILQKDTRLFFLQCETCGSRCSVASIKSGFQAVTGKRAAIRAKTA